MESLADLLVRGTTKSDLGCDCITSTPSYVPSGEWAEYYASLKTNVASDIESDAVGLIVDTSTHPPLKFLGFAPSGHMGMPTFVLSDLRGIKKISTGGYGTVMQYKAKDGAAALKIIPLSTVSIPALNPPALHELDLRDIPEHPNIVRALGIAFAKSKSTIAMPDRLVIAMEAAAMSLADAITAARKSLIPTFGRSLAFKTPTVSIGARDVCIMAYQMTCAVAHLHANHFRHNDIKPANFLLYGEQNPTTNTPWVRVALTDFGLAHSLERTAWTSVRQLGTTEYQAPELLLNETVMTPATPACDVWALACCIFELAVLGERRLFSPNPSGFDHGRHTKKTQEIRKDHTIQTILELLGSPPENLAGKIFPQYTRPTTRETRRTAPTKNKLYNFLKEKLRIYKHDDLLADMLSRMLKWDPRNRVSAVALLTLHPYFSAVAADVAAVHPTSLVSQPGIQYDENLIAIPASVTPMLVRRTDAHMLTTPALLPLTKIKKASRMALENARRYILSLSIYAPTSVMHVAHAAMTYLEAYARAVRPELRMGVGIDQTNHDARARSAACACVMIAIGFRTWHRVNIAFITKAREILGDIAVDGDVANTEMQRVLQALDFSLGIPTVHDHIIEHGFFFNMSEHTITAASLVSLASFFSPAISVQYMIEDISMTCLNIVYFPADPPHITNADVKVLADMLVTMLRTALKTPEFQQMLNFCIGFDEAIGPIVYSASELSVGKTRSRR